MKTITVKLEDEMNSRLETVLEDLNKVSKSRYKVTKQWFIEELIKQEVEKAEKSR